MTVNQFMNEGIPIYTEATLRENLTYDFHLANKGSEVGSTLSFLS